MKRLFVLFLLLSVLFAVGLVLAAPNSLAVSWWTVDGGGTVPELNGGSYKLQGTVGQADAGSLQNGRYTLNGGFWNPTMVTYAVYLPIIINP